MVGKECQWSLLQCIVPTACQVTACSVSHIIMLSPRLLKSVSTFPHARLHHTCSRISRVRFTNITMMLIRFRHVSLFFFFSLFFSLCLSHSLFPFFSLGLLFSVFFYLSFRCVFAHIVTCLWTCSEPATAFLLSGHWCAVGVLPGPTSVPSDAQTGWHRGQSVNSSV